MRELALFVHETGMMTEEYSIIENYNSDVALSYTVPESNVFLPDTFSIPFALRAALAEKIMPKGSTITDRMRAVAQTLPVELAVRMELLALEVDRHVKDAVTLPVHVPPDAENIISLAHWR